MKRSSNMLGAGLANLRNGIILNDSRISMAIADVLKRKIEDGVKGLLLRCSRTGDKSIIINGEMATEDSNKTEDEVRSVVTNLLSNKANVTNSINGLR